MEIKKTEPYKIILKFTLTDFRESPDFITEHLQLEPKHIAEKGKSFQGRPPARRSVWSFWVDVSAEHDLVEEQWISISKMLHPKRELIKNIRKNANLKFSVVAHANTDFPPITIPLEMIEFCNYVGAYIDIDLFGDLKNGEYS
jgi:hypothetical protein